MALECDESKRTEITLPVQIYSGLVSGPGLSLPQNLIHHFLITGDPVHGEDVEPQQRQHTQGGPYILAPVTSQKHHSAGLIRQMPNLVQKHVFAADPFISVPLSPGAKSRWNTVILLFPLRGVKEANSGADFMHASNSSSFPSLLLCCWMRSQSQSSYSGM